MNKKKYNNCVLPISYKDNKTEDIKWISYNILNDNYDITVSPMITLEHLMKTNLTYHGKFYINNKYQVVHFHAFEELVRFIYHHPLNFQIPKEYEEEYSKQELIYLKRLKDYLNMIDLKNYKVSNNVLKLEEKYIKLSKNKFNKIRLFFLDRKIEKIKLEEEIIRLKKTDAKKYINAIPKKIDNIDLYIDGKINYMFLNYNQKYHTSSIGKIFIMMDNEYNYKVIIQIIEEEIIKIKDIKENMINLKNEGFQNIKQYHKYLISNFNNEDESFNENSLIIYSKIKIVKKL